MTSIEVQIYAGGGDSDLCDITLDDRGWSIATPSTAEGSATTLAVAMGYRETGLWPLGTFNVFRVNYMGMPKGMRLRGSSVPFSTAVKSPVITNHENRTLGDIASDIAAAAGVSLSISSELAGRVIPYFNQRESSTTRSRSSEMGFSRSPNGAVASRHQGR